MGFAASSFASAMSYGASAVLRPRTGRHWMTPLTAWLARRAPSPAVSSMATHAEPPMAADIVMPSAPSRPALRVLKVVDGTPRQCAGRMVISGRMADVCAELDRLVAREAQRTSELRVASN